MSKLFPIRSSTETDRREPRLLELDDDSTDEVFDALGSETARQILLELHAGPRPASELANVVDTTIQNVQYHLTKLEAADLVEVADTWYAENGAEMDVYAPTDEALVLFAGRDPESSLQRLLRRLIGALAPLAAGAVVLAFWFDRARDGGDSGSDPVLATDGGATAAAGDSEQDGGGSYAQGAPGGAGDGGDAGDGDGVGGEGNLDGAGAESPDITDDVDGGNGTGFETDAPGDVDTETATSTATRIDESATDAAVASADAVGADPWLAAGLFVAGGVVALAGFYLTHRVLSSRAT